MHNSIEISKGALWPVVTGTITRPDDATFEMTNGDLITNAHVSSITLIIKKGGESIVDAEVDEFDVSADAKKIDWTYIWKEGDTEKTGDMEGQLVVELVDGRPAYAPTVPSEWFDVKIHDTL